MDAAAELRLALDVDDPLAPDADDRRDAHRLPELDVAGAEDAEAVDDADARPARLERDLAAERELADVALRAPGALTALQPGGLDVRLRDQADRGRRHRRPEGRRPLLPFGVRRARRTGVVAVASEGAGRGQGARERHRLLERRQDERQLLAIRRQVRRQVEQLRARLPVEATPRPLARHRHQVRVEGDQAARRARDERVDLDLDAKEGSEVRIGVEQGRIELRRADEDDAHAQRHRHRTERGRVQPERAEGVLGADALLAEHPLHPLPDDRIGQEVRGAHDEDAAARLVQRPGADAREVGQERAEAGTPLEVPEETRVRRVGVVDDGRGRAGRRARRAGSPGTD